MTDGVRWTDDHCHLHFRDIAASHVKGAEQHRDTHGEGVDAAVAAAVAAGVERMVTVGCDVTDSRAAIAVATRHAGVWATAGVHPHEADGGIEGLETLLTDPQVVAIGECGLDYHYDHSARPTQRKVFAAQIALAHVHRLPLVIHTREAWDETFDILAAEGMPERTVFHCFTGGPAEARRCLDIGGFLSFSGIVTFKTADELRAAAALCPLDRLLVETDSPYLTPVPHRGQPNRPEHLPLVGAGVAAAKGVPVEEIATATWVNAEAFYGLADST